MSGSYACLGWVSFLRLFGRISLAVALGGIFLAAAVAGSVAAERGGAVVETEASSCACASANDLSSPSGGGSLASTNDLDFLIPPKAIRVERARSGLRVLILGDSLALCGFGKGLDSRLRKLPQVWKK